jgi:hypothetical protein
VRYAGQYHKARIALPALNSAHIGQVNLGFESQLLLREADTLPETKNVCPNDSPPILRKQNGALTGL